MRRAVSQPSGVELFSGRGQPELEIAAPYVAVEEGLRAAYRQVWSRYRRDDEFEVRTENHRRLAQILGDLSSAFHQPIAVLDAGCGTGRYFHCLKGVERLVGMDLSPEMLAAARVPVRSEEISAREVDLLCANVFNHSWPPESFDFIYSLGMFGNGCPLTVELCDRFYEWLRPGGKLFFNTVEVATLPLRVRAKMKVRRQTCALATAQMGSEGSSGGIDPFFCCDQKRVGESAAGEPIREIFSCSSGVQFPAVARRPPGVSG